MPTRAGVDPSRGLAEHRADATAVPQASRPLRGSASSYRASGGDEPEHQRAKERDCVRGSVGDVGSVVSPSVSGKVGVEHPASIQQQQRAREARPLTTHGDPIRQVDRGAPLAASSLRLHVASMPESYAQAGSHSGQVGSLISVERCPGHDQAIWDSQGPAWNGSVYSWSDDHRCRRVGRLQLRNALPVRRRVPETERARSDSSRFSIVGARSATRPVAEERTEGALRH